MVSWQNGKLTKGQVDKMESWQNGKLKKWQVDKMANWQNSKLTKWQVDKMSSWQSGKLTKWQVDKMASWPKGSGQNGKLIRSQCTTPHILYQCIQKWISSLKNNIYCNMVIYLNDVPYSAKDGRTFFPQFWQQI